MTPRPWTVLPHGPLEDHQPNLKSVNGDLPRAQVGRRMSVARLADGRLAFFNAIPLGDAQMRALEAWGTPAILYAPNRFHRLDLHAYKQRYPQLKLFCSRETRTYVERVASVDGTHEDLPAAGDVSWVPLRGTKASEAVMVVRHEGHTSLCFGDALMNVPQLRGFEGLLWRLLGSTGSPKVTQVAQWVMVKSKPALADHLRELASLPGLERLIPTHGGIIESDAPAVLRNAAQTLHAPR